MVSPLRSTAGSPLPGVREVAKAHVAAWKNGAPRSQYVLGGANITFTSLYSSLAAITGKSQPFITIPKMLIYGGAVFAKALLGKRSPIDPEYVNSIIGNFSWYDSSKAVKELGYSIPPADETLKHGVNEVRYHLSGLANIRERSERRKIERTKYQNDDILLITGFPGWLANRMIDVLMNGDHNGQYAVDRKIRLLVQPSFKQFRFDLPKNIEIVYGDLKDKASIRDALNGVKAVYHCAGVIYPPKIRTLYDVNWRGTKNLVDACIESGVKRIINMGTDSICGYGAGKRVFSEDEPSNPYKNYGKSKYLAEQYILQKTKDGAIEGTSLRGFWFFGPHMPLRNQSLILMMQWKRQIIFGNGKNYRSLTHIDNVIQAFIKSEKSPQTVGKWYWMSDKEPLTTIDDIFGTMAEKMGLQYRPLYIPEYHLFHAFRCRYPARIFWDTASDHPRCRKIP
jgi:nucleoside-diphosphate-sugar epimerase